jgi:hypothetical protein
MMTNVSTPDEYSALSWIDIEETQRAKCHEDRFGAFERVITTEVTTHDRKQNGTESNTVPDSEFVSCMQDLNC